MLKAGFLLCASVSISAALEPGDSGRGARVFEQEQCIRCHSINGRGGKMGADFGKLVNRSYTPAHFAAAMWNQAPVMWRAMDRAAIRHPRLSPADAADLFAYFSSGSAQGASASPACAECVARGKQVFAGHRCATCHLEGDHGGPQLPGQGQRYNEMSIVSAIWSHGPRMLNRMKEAGIAWPQFRDAQELEDLLAYLNSVQ